MKHCAFLIAVLVATVLLNGCDKSAPPEQKTSEPQLAKTFLPDELLTTLSANTFQHTTELLHLSHQLHIATTGFLEQPSPEKLKDAQNTYNLLLSQWAQSLPYIYMTALTTQGAPLVNRIEKLPMLPGYLDELPDYPYSGLVHDIMLPIQPESLKRLHTLDNDEQVIFGLSAIEFLLFDHFQSDHYQQFLIQNELPEEEASQEILIEQLPNNRRRSLLKLQVEQLVEDTSELHKRWQLPNGEDTKKFNALISKNLNLTLSKSYQKATWLVLDALNSIQEKPLLLGRAHFSRAETELLNVGIETLTGYHQSLSSIWAVFPQPEKEEFTAVLNSLSELIQQYQQEPSNSLLLELASNRCNQLLELSHDLVFQPE